MLRCVVTIASLLLCLCYGCGVYFKPSRDLSRRVEEAEIVGEWKLTADSIALLKRDRVVRDPVGRDLFVFGRDGRLSLEDLVRTPQGRRDHAIRGSWKLEYDTNANSNIRYNNAILLHIHDPKEPHSRWLNIDEMDGRLRLWSYYGDPDLWEFMEYERVE